MANLVDHANNFSAQWAEGMWAALWQSAVLAAVIFVLTLFLKRASSSLRFWLWMLVPLRLLVMPLITIDLPVLPAEIASMPTADVFVPVESDSQGAAAPPENVPGGFTSGELAPTEGLPTAVSASDVRAEIASPARTLPSVWTCLMAAWVCGAMFIALRLGIGYWKTRRLVARATLVPKGKYVDLTRQAARMLELRRIPDVRITKEQVSPFVLGVWAPVVVLPASFLARVNHKQLLAVLAHEAAHLRRNDFLIGWVIATCEILFFFHPVVHFVNRKLLLEREKACDDWVLVTSRAKPSHYAQAILAAANSSGLVEKHLQPQAIVAESFTMLKHRLASMASMVKPKAGLSAWACIPVVALGIVCVPGIALTAKTSNPAEADNPPGVVSEIDSATATAVEHVAQATTETNEYRVIRFPEDSQLGTLSVLKNRRTHPYRLDRVEGATDQWEFLSPARGRVRVPVGKPLKLVVYNGGLPYIAHLSSLAPGDIDTLSFQFGDSKNFGRDITDEQILPYIQHLTGLKALELYGVKTTGKGFHYLNDLRDLERLEFGSDNYFEDASLAHLKNLYSLQALNLYAPVSDEGLQHLTALRSLRELTLRYQNIRGPGLAHIANIPNLEFLQIRGDGIGNSSGGPSNTDLKYLAGSRSLRSLMLYSTTRITDGAIPHLAKIPSLEELKFVKFGDTLKFTDGAMPALGTMTQLRVLDIGSTRVTDAGFAHLSGLVNLEKLRLPNIQRDGAGRYNITDAALAHVGNFTRLKELDVLGLSSYSASDPGPFTDAGLQRLSRLLRLERLRIISGNGVTDAGVAHIAMLKNLKELNLNVDGITNRGLASLSALRRLRILRLDAPEPFTISVAGVNHLNRLTLLKTLEVDNVAQDYSGLDLSHLTSLEWLMLDIRDSGGRKARNTTTDEDLRFVANLDRLTYLGIASGSSKITDEGLKMVANLKRLERLFIGGENVTDKGLEHIKGLTSLYQIGLAGDFTDQGMRQLADMKGLRYINLTTRRPMSGRTEQYIRRALPDLYSMNEVHLAGSN